MFTTILIIFCKNTNKRNIPKEKANKKYGKPLFY